MLRFIATRLVSMLPVLFLVTLAVFSLMLLLPGDPAIAMLGEQPDPDRLARLRKDLGLEQPVHLQYVQWLGKALRGDLGRSVRTNVPVAEEIGRRLVPTVQIGLAAMAISLLIALPTGTLAALRRNSKMDTVGSVFAMVGIAMPSFWLGLLLALCFGLWLRWLPIAGYVSPTIDLGRSLRLTVMPATTLGAAMAAVIMRQVRSSLLEVLEQEYVTSARAKGLRERVVIGRHALRNALIPVTTIIGLQIGRMLGGAVIVETVFAVPGLGRLTVEAVMARDFPVVQGVVLVMAIGVLLANLAVDIAYAYLDPRIRYG